MSAFKNTFDAAREAYLQEHRPFGRGKRAAPPPQFVSINDADTQAPDPDDYDPHHQTRYATDPSTPPPSTVKAALYEAFMREDYTLDFLTPARIRVAYRITRALAMACRATRSDETLQDATEICTYTPDGLPVDPWITPRELPKNLPISAIIADRSNPDLDAPDYRHIEALADIHTKNPDARISLMPPNIPKRFINSKTREVSPYYDASNPNHDMPLAVYMGAMRAIYNMLGICRGSFREPYYGVNGYAGLDDASTIRMAFPTRGELLAFESGVLIPDTLKHLVELGTTGTRRELKAEYGFTDRECTWTISMARSHAAQIVSTDVDQEKNIMILRLEDYIRRSREGYDLKAEAKAIQMLAQVLGITRSEPNDFTTDAAKLIREWSSKTGEQLARAPVAPHVLATLPPPGEAPTPR